VLLTLDAGAGAIAEGDPLRGWPASQLPAVGLAAPVKRLWLAAAQAIKPSNPGRRKSMSRTVMCASTAKNCRARRAALPGPERSGDLRERLEEGLGGVAGHQTMLINEKHLSLADPQARKYLQQEMDKFLSGEEYDRAEGYVPPES
jgi:Fe-S cluster biosynthesis and repair protein YggX